MCKGKVADANAHLLMSIPPDLPPEDVPGPKLEKKNIWCWEWWHGVTILHSFLLQPTAKSAPAEGSVGLTAAEHAGDNTCPQ